MDHDGDLTRDEIAFIQRSVNSWRTPPKPNLIERHPYISSILALAILFQGALWIASNYLEHFKKYDVAFLGFFAIFTLCAGLYMAVQGEEISIPIACISFQSFFNMQYRYFGHFPKNVGQWGLIVLQVLIGVIFCLFLKAVVQHVQAVAKAAYRSEEPIYR